MRTSKYFLLIFLLLYTERSLAQDDSRLIKNARESRLWIQPKWLRLGHYRKKISGYKSEVDEPAFFLAPDGKTNPQGELEATLKLFGRAPDLAKTISDRVCRYPARFEWLKQELDPNGNELLRPDCPELDEWIEKLNTQSLTLVFASAFLNSPASMYGHTFLRADNAPRNITTGSILNYSINFSADATDTNGFLFAVKGLLGGYKGRFGTVPYYMQIQTYGNIENRDLWEYRLNLNPKEIRALLNHLWELGDAYFDYFFTSENCSYQLLPLLEVARPDLDLSRKFWLRTIPVDTVRAFLSVPGLAVERTMRPSAIRKMKKNRDGLASHEIKIAERIAFNPEQNLPGLLDEISEKQKGRVIQTAYQYFRFRHGFNRYQDEKSDAQERKMLLAMSQLEIPKEVEVQEGSDEKDPAMGHRSARVGISGGQREDRWVSEVSVRNALHDLLDDSRGYVPHSRLEMLNLSVRYSDMNQRVFINRFTLIDLLSLAPIDRWFRKPSWGVLAGFDSLRDARVQSWDTTYFHVNTYSGLSFAFPFLGREAMIYGLGQLDAGAGPAFDPNYRFGAGILSGATVELSEWFKVLGEINYRHYVAGDTGRAFGFKVAPAISVGRNATVRFTYEQEESVREFLLSLYYYL